MAAADELKKRRIHFRKVINLVPKIHRPLPLAFIRKFASILAPCRDRFDQDVVLYPVIRMCFGPGSPRNEMLPTQID